MPTELGWLAWIFIGGFAGWAAGALLSFGKRMGCILNVLVGIVGAVIGGWVFTQLGVEPPGGRYLSSLVTAFVGALLMLGLLRLVSPK